MATICAHTQKVATTFLKDTVLRAACCENKRLALVQNRTLGQASVGILARIIIALCNQIPGKAVAVGEEDNRDEERDRK